MPKNLRDLLVSATLKPPHLEEANGSLPCGSKRCLTCQHIRSGTTVKSSSTGRTFNIRATANCKSSNVIYLIQCTLCNMQYIGETPNPLHIRLNGHRCDIRHGYVDKPVADYLNSLNHHITNLSIMVLEEVKMETLGKKERAIRFINYNHYTQED